MCKKKAPARAPKPKAPPCPQRWKVTMPITEFIHEMRVRIALLHSRIRTMRLKLHQTQYPSPLMIPLSPHIPSQAFVFMVSCLETPAVTDQRIRSKVISNSSRTCCRRLGELAQSPRLETRSAIAMVTLQLSRQIHRTGSIPHLISGALQGRLILRTRLTRRPGLKTGKTAPQPSLVCTTTSTRRFGLCSSIEPFGDVRNFVMP